MMLPQSLPERSLGYPARKTSRLGCYLLGISACMLIALGLLGYVAYLSKRTPPTVPAVTITFPEPGSNIAVGESVVVSAVANDRDRIARVEFWINGQLLGTQVGTDPKGTTPFMASQVWRPAKAGAYTIRVRAIDTENISGDSDTLVLEAGNRERETGMDSQVIVGPKDTLDTIAKETGSTPKDIVGANPDLATRAPHPGESIDVPLPTETRHEEPPAPDIPTVDIPTPPPPPPLPPESSGSVPVPRLPPFLSGTGKVCFLIPALCTWRGSALVPFRPDCVLNPAACSPPPGFSDWGDPVGAVDGWGRRYCEENPGAPGCSRSPTPGGTPPTVPRAVWPFLDGCRITIRWTDDSNNEDGFNVYRITRGNPLPQLVFPALANSPFAIDASPPPGTHFYFVEAFNENGANQTAPTVGLTIPTTCQPTSPDTALEIEALEFRIRPAIEKFYCYAVIADQSQRVPADPTQFVRFESGRGWNLAGQFPGENRKRVIVPGDAPLRILLECLGWRGGDLMNLGRLEATHPPSDWNGRTLTGDARDFSVSYAIRHVTEAPTDEIGRATSALIDPSIPRPYNLQLRPCPGGWPDTCPHTEGLNAIGMLTWEWSAERGSHVSVSSFKIIMLSASRRGFGSISDPRPPDPVPDPARDVFVNVRGRERRVGLLHRCEDRTLYYVQAVTTKRDERTHEFLESPLSDPLEISEGACPAIVEFTLETLRPLYTHDGCNYNQDPFDNACAPDDWIEGYGTFRLNSYVIKWNRYAAEDTPADCPTTNITSGRPPPKVTTLMPNSEFPFSILYLATYGYFTHRSVRVGTWQAQQCLHQNNNVFRLWMSDGEPITFSWNMKDWDVGPNDPWCSGAVVFQGRSIQQWATGNETHTAWTGDHHCEIDIRIRGLGVGSP